MEGELIACRADAGSAIRTNGGFWGAWRANRAPQPLAPQLRLGAVALTDDRRGARGRPIKRLNNPTRRRR